MDYPTWELSKEIADSLPGGKDEGKQYGKDLDFDPNAPASHDGYGWSDDLVENSQKTPPKGTRR